MHSPSFVHLNFAPITLPRLMRSAPRFGILLFGLVRGHCSVVPHGPTLNFHHNNLGDISPMKMAFHFICQFYGRFVPLPMTWDWWQRAIDRRTEPWNRYSSTGMFGESPSFNFLGHFHHILVIRLSLSLRSSRGCPGWRGQMSPLIPGRLDPCWRLGVVARLACQSCHSLSEVL